MNAAVVDKRSFYDIVPGRLEKARNAVAQKVVAYMPQVKGLVGIGRGELHHHTAPGRRQLTVIPGRKNLLKVLAPPDIAEAEVQEPLHRIESAEFGAVPNEPLPYLLRSDRGSFAGRFQERKYDQGIVALEVLAGHAHLHLLLRNVRPIQDFYGLNSLGGNKTFGRHQPR